VTGEKSAVDQSPITP